jgi:hypothetical protein
MTRTSSTSTSGTVTLIWVIETIRDLPSLTSVFADEDTRLSDIQHDSPLLVGADDTNISTFLHDNESRLAKTPHTFIFISNSGPRGWAAPRFSSTEIGLMVPAIAISFFGPSSRSLTLRLRHRSSRPDATLTVTGFPAFKLPIPSSLTRHDIRLHADCSNRLSFTSNSRNNLIIQVEASWDEPYWLQDIQLLDESGRPHNPRPSEAPDLSTSESEGTGDAAQSITEAGGVNVNSGISHDWHTIEEERR